MIALNLVAAALMITCVVFRFIYYTDNGASEFKFFSFILTIYLALFVILLVLAEFRVQKIRTYFDVLDSKWGRGWFILFIALLVLEVHTALEVILCILAILIALFNMLVGWNQGSDGKDAQQKKRER
jgi:hypothetical protein